MKSAYVNHLIIYDYYDFDFSESDGCITLGVSNDDKVHFSDLFNESEITNSTLRLKNYQGLVLIPTNTALQITDTIKNINGTIGTPAYINCDGDINLDISKESGLELCLTSNCDVSINEILSVYKSSERMKEPVSTRSYRSFEQRYMQYTKNNPRISDKSTPLIMDMCMHYNLLYIEKDNGKISLQYTPPKLESNIDVILRDKYNICKNLQREILLATNEGKILKASYKKTELEKMLFEIDQISKIISNPSRDPNSQKLEQ